MNSIRHRLTVTLALALGGLLALSGALVWWLVRRELTAQFDASLAAAAQIVAASTEVDDGELEVDADWLQSDGFNTRNPDFFYEIRDPNNRPAVRSPGTGRAQFAALSPPVTEAPEFHALTWADGRPARAVVMRFDPDDDKDGSFRDSLLIFARRSEALHETMMTLGLVLIGTGLAVLVLLIPLIGGTLARGLRPLTELAQRASRIDANRLDERLPESGTAAELRPITAALNALLARLEHSFARERRFSSDVAHELRTPLAELRSLAELAERWPEHATPEAFAQVRAITDEMTTLTAALTSLARVESGAETATLVPTELASLVEDVLARGQKTVEARRLRLATYLPKVRARTSADHWRLIATNLIGNAFAHAPEGSEVKVALDDATLIVRNEAPELEEPDVPKLRERFWRKDAARFGYGHSGLGLPLAYSLAEMLGHRLEARLAQGWLEFRLEAAREPEPESPAPAPEAPVHQEPFSRPLPTTAPSPTHPF